MTLTITLRMTVFLFMSITLPYAFHTSNHTFTVNHCLAPLTPLHIIHPFYYSIAPATSHRLCMLSALTYSNVYNHYYKNEKMLYGMKMHFVINGDEHSFVKVQNNNQISQIYNNINNSSNMNKCSHNSAQ